MPMEFGEGERNERREDETDELEELRDRVRARGERLGEAGQERNELDEFGSYVEYLKMKYGPEGGAKPSALAPEQTDRTQDELEVGAYHREEKADRWEQLRLSALIRDRRIRKGVRPPRGQLSWRAGSSRRKLGASSRPRA